MQFNPSNTDQNVREVVVEAQNYSASLERSASENTRTSKIVFFVLLIFAVVCALLVVAVRILS